MPAGIITVYLGKCGGLVVIVRLCLSHLDLLAGLVVRAVPVFAHLGRPALCLPPLTQGKRDYSASISYRS